MFKTIDKVTEHIFLNISPCRLRFGILGNLRNPRATGRYVIQTYPTGIFRSNFIKSIVIEYQPVSPRPLVFPVMPVDLYKTPYHILYRLQFAVLNIVDNPLFLISDGSSRKRRFKTAPI